MKAAFLSEGASYDPATLKIIYEAFDAAWCELEPWFSAQPQAIHGARARLADTTLTVAKDGVLNAQDLAHAALLATRMKLPPGLGHA